MGRPVLVVLLLCLSGTWAQAESGDDDNVSADIWAELKDLRDMVVEQRVELKFTKAKLQTQKDKVAVLEKEKSVQVIALVSKVRTDQKEVTIKLWGKLAISKNKLDEIQTTFAGILIKTTKISCNMTTAELRETKTELELLKTKVEELMNENVKCAFTAGFDVKGHIGPYDTEKTLVYGKVLTNVGGAYNPQTGIFTAPVKGVYYIRFTAYTETSGKWTGVYLYHNDQKVLRNFERGSPALIANGLVLQMEKGSVVYMTLCPNFALYDYEDYRTTFSGFLLYRL